MIKCPYCQGTMKKGFIEAEGKWGLLKQLNQIFFMKNNGKISPNS